MLQTLLFGLSVLVVFGYGSPNAKFIRKRYGRSRIDNSVMEDATLDVPDLVKKYGYPIESHQVYSADGYLLMMHRIPYGKSNNNQYLNKKPALLMHGLLSSSADFLVLGPESSLGYLLADEGYDVWMGNARGNYYSRHHLHMNPDSNTSQEFWKFSWDEIGIYDVSAFVDHIIYTTKQPKVHYVGHSQGGTSFLVLNSMRPEYNQKFISFQGLAPASYFTNFEYIALRSLSAFENILEPAAYAIGLGELLGNRELVDWFYQNFCTQKITLLDPVCHTVAVSGKSDHFNQTLIPVLQGHSPAGASVRQFVHYGQCVKFDTFSRYSHNDALNKRFYGTWRPPPYDVSKITVPTYLHYAMKDTLVNYKDLKILASKMSNIIGTYLVDDEVFDHYDFIWSVNVKSVVYYKVLMLMKHAENSFL